MKDIKTILLASSCVVLLFLSFYFINKVTKLESTQNNLSEFITKIQEKEGFYNLNIEYNNKMLGERAPNLLCTRRNSERKPLSEFVPIKPLLIYRYTDVKCSTCSQNETGTELIELKNMFSDMPDLALILSSSYAIKDLLIFAKMSDIDIPIPIYYTSLNAFDWIAEDNDNSYFFVLHPDMKISHIYVPDKKFPDLNRQYLEGVKRFLSE